MIDIDSLPNINSIPEKQSTNIDDLPHVNSSMSVDNLPKVEGSSWIDKLKETQKEVNASQMKDINSNPLVSLSKGIGTGAANIAKMAISTPIRMYSDAMLKESMQTGNKNKANLAKQAGELSNKINNYGSEFLNQVNNSIPQDKINQFSAKVGSAAPTLLGALGVSTLTGGTAIAPALMFGSIGYFDKYNEARNAGKDPDEAGNLALVNGTGQALIAKLNIPGIVNPEQANILEKVVHSAVNGALLNSGSTIIDNLITKYGNIDKARQVFEGAGASALMGGFLGASMHALELPASLKKDLVDSGISEKEINQIETKITNGLKSKLDKAVVDKKLSNLDFSSSTSPAEDKQILKDAGIKPEFHDAILNGLAMQPETKIRYEIGQAVPGLKDLYQTYASLAMKDADHPLNMKLRNATSKYNLMSTSLSGLLDAIGGGDSKSEIHRQFVEPILNADDTNTDFHNSLTKPVSEQILKLKEAINKNQIEQNVKFGGKSYNVRERMSIYAHSQNPQDSAWMAARGQASIETQRNIQNYINKNEPQIVAVVKAIADGSKNALDLVNKQLTSEGRDPIKGIESYYKRVQAEGKTIKPVQEDLDLDTYLEHNRLAIEQGFTKSRVGIPNGTLNLDLIANYAQHIDEAVKYATYGHIVRDIVPSLRRLYPLIDSKIGPKLTPQIESKLRTMINGPKRTGLDPFLGTVRKVSYQAAIPFNIRAILAHLTTSAGTAEIDPKNYLGVQKFTLANWKEVDNVLRNESAWYKNRMHDIDIPLRDLTLNKDGFVQNLRNVFNFFNQAGTLPLRGGDQRITAAGMLLAKAKALGLDLSNMKDTNSPEWKQLMQPNADAIKYAEQIGRETHMSPSNRSLKDFFQSGEGGELGKQFGAYRSQPTAIAYSLRNDFLNMRNMEERFGHTSPEAQQAKTQFLRHIAARWALPNIGLALIHSVPGLLNDKHSLTEKGEIVLGNFALASTHIFPFIGTLASTLQYGGSIMEIPNMRPVQTVVNTGKDIFSMANKFFNGTDISDENKFKLAIDLSAAIVTNILHTNPALVTTPLKAWEEYNKSGDTEATFKRFMGVNTRSSLKNNSTVAEQVFPNFAPKGGEETFPNA